MSPLSRCAVLAALAAVLAGPAPGSARETPRIHTVLPFDAIPAVFDPAFVSAEAADIHDDSPVIGVSIGGEQRAYSMVLLNVHEIVNDVVAGKPIATTW